MPRTTTDLPATSLDRIVAIFAALVIVALAVFLLIRNQPIADPRLFFLLRVVISFSAATLGATIPGFLSVGWSGGGLVVRAGGALALFALTFVYTPNLATDNASGLRIERKSEGPAAPPQQMARNQQNRDQLVGSWKANIQYGNLPVQIIWVIMPDGTSGYEISDGAKTIRLTTRWTYTDGVIYEHGSNGNFSSASIDWIDENHFIVTIKNNSDPRSEGSQRYYSRK